jgi:hypothetical protein
MASVIPVRLTAANRLCEARQPQRASFQSYLKAYFNRRELKFRDAYATRQVCPRPGRLDASLSRICLLNHVHGRSLMGTTGRNSKVAKTRRRKAFAAIRRASGVDVIWRGRRDSIPEEDATNQRWPNSGERSIDFGKLETP